MPTPAPHRGPGHLLAFTSIEMARMKLTRLELSGFKSFADTVTLTFDDGVTAIVGPNGCGKSNISDAVRWVLGEQSARLLRGGKMEDVIFQGSSARRPVNVTQVSLYLDNSGGELPTPYTEVVISRRLSRSGQSDYLLNGTVVRRRDLQDLLRGTGLSGEAGVVIEAKMIDTLLSDRADERRSLFEEAAGVGLYRDRRHTTTRRLEETAADLQRLEDLLAEVQSQVRSLARQKGKAERHTSLMEERFAVTLTLARRRLDRLAEETDNFEQRHAELQAALPEARERAVQLEQAREEAARARTQAERHRATVVEELSGVRVALERLEGDLAVVGERLTNAVHRRERAATERGDLEVRVQQARLELEAAREERSRADAEHHEVQQELSSRAAAEQQVRERLSAQRDVVRRMEQELQQAAQQLRSLEGERTALDGELASLRDRLTQEQTQLEQLAQERGSVAQRLAEARQAALAQEEASRQGTAAAEQARLLLRETRDREARELAERRTIEEDLARLGARRSALEALERDRVGLAPAAAALLAQRERFGDRIIGPLADTISTDGDQAELAEQLLGDYLHGILVRDAATVAEIRDWHTAEQPGTLILLPVNPGPGIPGGTIDGRLRVEEIATPWVAALVGGAEVLDGTGRALRHANGVVYLRGATAPTGPIRRRAELRTLAQGIDKATARLAEADQRRDATTVELAALDAAAIEAQRLADQQRETERQAVATQADLQRRSETLDREVVDHEQRVGRLAERIQRAEQRQQEIETELASGNNARARLDEALLTTRSQLGALEAEQERARESRSQWQVQEAHIAARQRAAGDAISRAERLITEAESSGQARSNEIVTLDADTATLDAQRTQWQRDQEETSRRRQILETAAREAEQALQAADAHLAGLETDLTQARQQVEAMSAEHHRLELGVAEASAQRGRIVERVETEWHRPFEALVEAAPMLDLDLETLETEAQRIAAALEQIGPVNALAVEEHAEESRRATFLAAQRDDLVAARQSLLQAIREIDGTAKALFMETFEAVRGHFLNVFQTLFGGGECDLRLTSPEDPLESEIEIHAAPRGKRTQRIHLLSSGERTLVAVSLLFSIYLTRPSPFCLMDEVDAPLDDANVGRFLRLLEEFKADTQFLVITHNPRTMQSGDSIYGVTMQEPGVSTIVGVQMGNRPA